MTTKLVCLTDPASPAAEAYRRLRVNLMIAPLGNGATVTAPERHAALHTLLVAAVSPDAEKAIFVANLAVTFARVGKKVVLVDCDLRHPAQHALFALDNQAGVTTVLGRAEGPLQGADLPLQTTSVLGLRVLTSGPAVEVPSELIASPQMAGLIARLRDEADVVLFDTPPVASTTDAAELATQMDGVLLTINAGHTKRDDARRAVDLLAKVGATLVGAVLVNVEGADAQVRNYLSTA
jgi:capsular exopolysaccharide synthesis family protein